MALPSRYSTAQYRRTGETVLLIQRTQTANFIFETGKFLHAVNNRIVLSGDHSAIDLRQTIAAHIATLGWDVVDIGPMTSVSTHYPKHGVAAARRYLWRLPVWYYALWYRTGHHDGGEQGKGHPLWGLQQCILSQDDPPTQRCQHALSRCARGG